MGVGRRRALLGLAVLVWGALEAAFLRSRLGPGDIEVYHRYALAFWAGTPPLRRLPLEYPPLSLAAFSLTLVPPGADPVYAFAAWMGIGTAILLLVIHRARGPRAALATAAYLGVGAFGTLVARFDVLPVMTTVLAVVLAERGRHRPAYALLAAGVLLKVYPVLLFPVLLAHQLRGDHSWQRVLRDLLGPVAMVLAGFGLAAAISPSGWLGTFTYAAARPLEVESAPATIAWILSGAGVPFRPDHSFHSYNVLTPIAGPLVAAGAALLVAGVACTTWQVWRGRRSPAAAAAAVVVLLIVTGKVLSPQYMIWALPLVALAEGRTRRRWLLVAALTTIEFPVIYELASLYGQATPAAYPGALLAVIAARNALLAGLAVLLLAGRVGEQPLAGGDVEPVVGGAGRDEVLGDRDAGLGHDRATGSVETPQVPALEVDVPDHSAGDDG